MARLACATIYIRLKLSFSLVLGSSDVYIVWVCARLLCAAAYAHLFAPQGNREIIFYTGRADGCSYCLIYNSIAGLLYSV